MTVKTSRIEKLMSLLEFDDAPGYRALTATTAIYNALKSDIVSLRRRPGEPVRRPHIAQQFGVSSTPIHEAMRRLEVDGLVTSVYGKGTYVAPIPLDGLATAIEARRALEQLTVRCAAERATPESLDWLRKALDTQRQAMARADHPAFYRADEQFHGLVARIAAHPLFWNVAQKTKTQVDRCLRLSRSAPDHIRAFVADHEAIVEAIAASDPAQADEALSRHFETVRTVVQTTVREMPEFFEGTLRL